MTTLIRPRQILVLRAALDNKALQTTALRAAPERRLVGQTCR
jgi:hypothetical protein